MDEGDGEDPGDHVELLPRRGLRMTARLGHFRATVLFDPSEPASAVSDRLEHLVSLTGRVMWFEADQRCGEEVTAQLRFAGAPAVHLRAVLWPLHDADVVVGSGALRRGLFRRALQQRIHPADEGRGQASGATVIPIREGLLRVREQILGSRHGVILGPAGAGNGFLG